MKKLTRKTLITILSLALIIVILGTTTFAWITISNRAAVQGMEFEVDTPNGLQIERGEEIVEKNFTNKIIESQYNGIKYLQPVSSVDGKDFYFTPNLLSGVDGRGQLTNTAKIYEYDDESFKQLYDGIYDVKVQGYAEYTYILKAVASSENTSVYLNEMNFNYDGAEDASNAYKAFRVAVLTKQYNGEAFDDEYTSLGVISASASKNNTPGAAVGNTTPASEITIGDDTFEVYQSSYGYMLYKKGDTYYTDLGQTEYTLKAGDNALANTANRFALRKAEFVLGVSFKLHENGLYEFTTNLGNKVYGANQESVENDKFYLVDGTTEAELNDEAEKVEGTSTVERTDINGVKYYQFTTSRGEEVYGKSANADENTAYYKLTFLEETATPTTSYLDEVKEFDATKPLMEVEEGKIGYVMVTLRIYVEGEDENCNIATFVTLNNSFKMDVAFGLDQPQENIKLN